MTESTAVSPLMLLVALTDEQRRQIQEQTGLNLPALPYESAASVLRCDFGGITLRVARGVFVPAPVTEQLLYRALDASRLHSEAVIVEVGTGCGAIALAAAAALPRARVVGTDISQAALRCARQNRARLQLRNVRILSGSLLSPLPARMRRNVTVIIANVPYMPPRLSGALARSFPAQTAIGTGEDGLGLPRALADTARTFLMPGGKLLLQLAGFQWPVLSPELAALGYLVATPDRVQDDRAITVSATWPG